MIKNSDFVINDHTFRKRIDKSDIEKRVNELAAAIRNDFAGKTITYLIVLKGAFVFAADLIRAINLPSEIIFIEAKSYGEKMKSSGKVVLNHNKLNLNGKNILIIEDIIDSGNTMKTLTESFRSQNPEMLEIAAFLSKPSVREVELNIKYVGFEIPPDFVIGYGLDYAEQGRHLTHIYAKI